MAQVRSLAQTIVLQFAIIVVPIALLFVYQAFVDVQHANRVKFELQSGLLAQRADASYKIFLNGMADAVDSGFLGSRAVRALEQTHEALLAFETWDQRSEVGPLRETVQTLLEAARDRQSLEGLLPLRPLVQRASRLLAELVDAQKLRERENIERIAEDTKKQVWVTIATLIVAIGLVFLLSRRLTEPLHRAVALANEVAAGDFKADKIIDTGGDVGGLLTSLAAMRDNLRQSFLDLARNERRLSNAQRIASAGDWEIDLTTGSLIKSDAFYLVVGYERGTLRNPSIIPPEIVHPADRRLVEQNLEAAQRQGKELSFDFRVVLPNGDTRFVHLQSESVRDDAGAPVRIAGTIQDVTAHKLAERKIERLALHDSLTGLVNRQYFEEQLNKELAAAVRHGYSLAVLFLDLDRFKNVNDSLGHLIGDKLLKEVANRLVKSVRQGESVVGRFEESSDSTLARMGGDEFTVLLSHLGHVEDAARVAQRILDSLTLPFIFEGQEVFIGTSIGISVYPIDGSDHDELLKNADIAMYHAKNEGGNNYQYFKESLKQDASLRLTLESDLRKALSQEQFLLHYQPQVDIATRQIFGVEALIRWQHPERGLVPPVTFIPFAEESGLIIPITEWVLRTACAQVRAWQQAGFGGISVAVNIASPLFSRTNLTEVVRDALAGSGLDARHLELEVTESIMVERMESVLSTLKGLRNLGIGLSMDDFGTGYSSLSYLQRFPIDTLKIDRSFVHTLEKAEGLAIVQAIIGMGKALHLKLIAEGVETEGQAQVLLDNGCAAMQGYLFSRPLAADAMLQLLRR